MPRAIRRWWRSCGMCSDGECTHFKAVKLKLLLSLALFLGMTTLHATNQESTTVSGLKATVRWGFISVESSEDSLLDGNCYLTNISAKPINVVTGSALGPRLSTGLIYYGISIVRAEMSPTEPVKPTPGQLDIVELKPGETVLLKHFRKEINKEASAVRLVYGIDRELKMFYPDVWCDELQVIIPIQRKPSSGK